MKNKLSHSIIKLHSLSSGCFISAPNLISLEGKHIKTETGIEIKLQGTDQKVGVARLPYQFRILTSSGFLFCILERDIKTGKSFIYLSGISERTLPGMKKYEIY